MANPPASLVTVCSICGAPMNAKGDCLACLIRSGVEEKSVEANRSEAPLAFGDFEVEREPDGTLRELGRGAMGVTYLARDTVLRRSVALKVIELPTTARRSQAKRQRFLREARAAAALRHPNVAAVFQFGAAPDGTRCYYAMELVEGETLEDRVRREGPLDAKPALEIALQIARALVAAAAHGLIHRDLKPGNIMLTSGETAMEVKVIDFGLARAIAEGAEQMNLTHGGFVGTPNFASPEQFGSGTVDARSDIYSLGATLWFAVTGLVPYPGKTIEEIGNRQTLDELPMEQLAARKVPRPLMKLLRSTLALEPVERPASAKELVTALRSCRRKMSRRIGALYALGMLTALIIMGALIWPTLAKRTPDARAFFQEAKILAAHSSSHLEGRQNNPRVIQLLEKAVKLDPDFAPAHAELALAYTIRLFLYAPEEKHLQEKAYLEVERALALDAKLPSAYLARGRLKWTPSHHFPHEDAINDFKRALTQAPNLDEAHHYLGLVLLHVGLLEEARAAFETAVALNPGNNGAQFRVGETLFFEGRFREARNVFERIDPDFNPTLRAYQLALSLFSLGQIDEAQTGLDDYLKNNPDERGGLLASVQAMIFAAAGRQNDAEGMIQAAQASRGFGHFHHTEYNIASAYALMNKIELGVDWFERTVGDGFNCYPMFKNDSNLNNLRYDPRFQQIMEAERMKWESYRTKFGR